MGQLHSQRLWCKLLIKETGSRASTSASAVHSSRLERVHKSFKRKDGDDDSDTSSDSASDMAASPCMSAPAARGGGRFKGEKRRNGTHESSTDADVRRYRKSDTASELRDMGSTLAGNRHDLIASLMDSIDSGQAEREVVKGLAGRSVPGGRVDRFVNIHESLLMRRLQLITSRHRAPSTNAMLGLFLAFNAGAINAGGFLVLHMYTSHMSGFASQFAEGLALDNSMVLLNALGAIFAFTLGAAVCSFLVNWARQHQLHSVYALPLMLEALLMLPFGLMGAVTLKWNTPFALPMTVLLLSFIMGLQNALGSKTSEGSIRTTHMTGNITDFGMEMGKLFFWRGRGQVSVDQVPLNWQRAGMCGGLVVMFVLGGILGALGFKHIGFICVVPLAIVLLALSVPPFLRDVPDPRNLFSS